MANNPVNIWLDTPYRVSISYNGDFYYITPAHSIRLRPDPAAQKWLVMPDASDKELGEAVIDALAQSRCYREIGPVKSTEERETISNNYDLWEANIRARFRYKTKKAMYSLMKNCGVSVLEKENLYKLTPTRHEKLNSWGREKGDGIEDVCIPLDSTPEELGAALRVAFSRCTGPGAD